MEVKGWGTTLLFNQPGKLFKGLLEHQCLQYSPRIRAAFPHASAGTRTKHASVEQGRCVVSTVQRHNTRDWLDLLYIEHNFTKHSVVKQGGGVFTTATNMVLTLHSNQYMPPFYKGRDVLRLPYIQYWFTQYPDYWMCRCSYNPYSRVLVSLMVRQLNSFEMSHSRFQCIESTVYYITWQLRRCSCNSCGWVLVRCWLMNMPHNSIQCIEQCIITQCIIYHGSCVDAAIYLCDLKINNVNIDHNYNNQFEYALDYVFNIYVYREK